MQTALVKEPAIRHRRIKRSRKALDTDMLVKLYELLQGERESITVFSHALGCEIRFYNPVLISEEADSPIPSYSTRELAFVMSLDEEEFRRYHYLKVRLA